MTTSASKTGGHAVEVHGGTGHVVPPALLAGVLAALLVLTVATVAITWLDLGEFNLWLAMAIATIKGALVCLFFMHMYWDRPIIPIIFLSALALVALFVGLTLTDTGQALPNLIPDYAPEVNR